MSARSWVFLFPMLWITSWPWHLPCPLFSAATRGRNTNKWSIESGPHVHASQDTPYRRDTPNSQRAENWSLDEMIILLDAKKIEDNVYATGGLCKKIRSAKDKWGAISARCVENNVQKTPHQCWVKWVKLNKAFRKIFRYEREISTTEESFWNLSTKARKEKSLPTSLNQDVFNAMVERFGSEPEAKRGGLLIELPYDGDEQSNGGEPVPSQVEMQDDLLSMSSQQVNYRFKRPKLEPKPPVSKKDTVYNTKQLIERYESMEYNKLEIERERIACDEKRNISICNAISEIASAIRSIAEALQNKK
ncbi:hypothetical protein O6H91_14G063300 [Diphasiastrum complanatum]|uniref:Uncharacterized protein n=1 Tax=Diphasiastrum complanatum TaxID=34168 RepID=A0ACC2BQU7_DIPCM|nr:hypothetical protein O6H91_14G063300 [Diphasiastrum complanatum]